MKIIAALFLMCVSTMGQSTNTGAAETKGPCSPANTGNNNTFSINCGIGQAQGKKMIAILNTILENQLDPSAVMSKLDDIIAEINTIKGQEGPWVLDIDTEKKMFKVLASAPQVPIVVDVWSDSSRRFAGGLLDLFNGRLKWPTEVRGGMSFGPPPIGIACFGPDKLASEMPRVEAALQLINPEIHCNSVPASQLRPEDREAIRIQVGERP